jgi:peptidoglycan/xylan/chitin deacetylase (PgdA/CDA1 family)
MNTIKELIRTILFIFGRLFYNNKKSKVLYYHDVSLVNGSSYTPLSTPYHDFVSQMNLLRRYGDIVDEISKVEGQFHIAFDDGFKGVYDNKEFFLENNIHPTIFVANNLIGTVGYMNESQIIELSSLGFNIQSHSVSHCDLSNLDIESLDKELKDSKQYLENLLKKETTSICCPMGYYNDMVIREAKKMGYKHIYLSYPSPYNREDFIIGRYFCQSLNLFQFKLLLFGGMDILKSRYIKQHYRIKTK